MGDAEIDSVRPCEREAHSVAVGMHLLEAESLRCLSLAPKMVLP